MFRIFKRRSKEAELSLIELSRDGYCPVVGESHYQEALKAASRSCSINAEGRPTFTAALVPEPDNPYDSNAVAIHSSVGKVGYLSREDAKACEEVFAETTRLGYHGGECAAYLTGGEPGKPSIGVVLQLASPETCLDELADE